MESLQVIPNELITRVKFRAECFPDVYEVLILIHPDCLISVEIYSIPDEIGHFFPDKEVILGLRDFSIERLSCLMKETEDGHVMLESLNYEDNYTGERSPKTGGLFYAS